MIEAEWLAASDPDPMPKDEWWAASGDTMLEFLRGKASDRKLRLFAVAAYRRFWPMFTDHRNQRVVDVMEQCADSLVPDEVLAAAFQEAEGAKNGLAPQVDSVSFYSEKTYSTSVGMGLRSCPLHTTGAEKAWWEACVATRTPRAARRTPKAQQKESRYQTSLLRCLFDNLFRPVTFSPAWRTDTAVALARQMYESRDFGAMPILADALQDAGCDSADVLDHCRGPGPHVRGCWVVDLVLGKE